MNFFISPKKETAPWWVVRGQYKDSKEVTRKGSASINLCDGLESYAGKEPGLEGASAVID